MKSGVECIITGCWLVSPQENKWAHGDLHTVGTCFVFNAVTNLRQGKIDSGETMWFYGASVPETVATNPEQDGARCIILDQPYYFERRGIIVFDALHSHFNQAAKDYLLPQLKEKQDGKETNPADSGGFFSRFLRSSRR